MHKFSESFAFQEKLSHLQLAHKAPKFIAYYLFIILGIFRSLNNFLSGF